MNGKKDGLDLEALRTLRRLRIAHLLGAALLLIYLAGGALLYWLYFAPHRRTGLLNASSSVQAAALWMAGAAVLLIQFPALTLILRRMRTALEHLASGRGEEFNLAGLKLRRGLAQAQAISAAAGAAGLGVFLATGDWRSFLFLLGASAAAYAQSYPGREWREALLGHAH
jgi:hypothetical protein